jgi:hypothetical protein
LTYVLESLCYKGPTCESRQADTVLQNVAPKITLTPPTASHKLDSFRCIIKHQVIVFSFISRDLLRTVNLDFVLFS